jgi:hypothetical protein
MTPDEISEMINDLLDDLPLQEQVLIANMSEFDVSVLQAVFGRYIKSLAGADEDPDEILIRLWEQLQKTHRLRVVK